MTMLGTFLKPMHPEGYRFVGIFAAITLVLFWLWEPLGWLGLGHGWHLVWCATSLGQTACLMRV